MIDSHDFEALRGIGLTQPLAQNLLALGEPGGVPMRVVEQQRDRVHLHDGHAQHVARVLPVLTHALEAADDTLAVGDWVLARRNLHHEWWVHARVPPLTRLSRRDRTGQRQTLVHNADTAMLVMGLDSDFNLRRLERYLTLARLAEVGALVVLTKADTCADTESRDAMLASVQAQLPPGVDAVAVNGLDAGSRDVLAPWLAAGQTLVLLGSSGAGKSTLTNTLAASAVADTGEVRESDGRGMHTTTARTLHRCPGGACIIDTPGLRKLRLDADESQIASAFEDIARLALQCRFRDCRHLDEPGCAVREQVPAERLRNWHKLLREARRDTQSALERRAQASQWKARGRDARVRAQAKRG